MSSPEIKANSIILKTIYWLTYHSTEHNIRYFIQFSNSKTHKRQSKKKLLFIYNTSKTVFIIDIYGIVKIQNKSINLPENFYIKPKFNKKIFFYVSLCYYWKMHFHSVWYENFAFYFAVDKKWQDFAIKLLFCKQFSLMDEVNRT